MNFLQHLTGGSSSASGHTRGAAYSHRSTKESTGRRVHADADHDSPLPRFDDNHTTVGTVLMMHQDRSQYPVSRDGKILPKESFFKGVLAPDCDTALAFLSAQPPGAYLLVKEATDDIAVYVKFRQAVRSFTVVKAKDVKKTKATEDMIEWGKAYRLLQHSDPHSDALNSQSTVMTPIHRLYLPVELYQFVERCWLRFLPQVQAIVFELCSQSYYMDEEMAMEDWSASILMARVPCMAFVSEDACSFHLFNTSSIAEGELASPTHAAAAHSVGIPVRVVEFDVVRCAVLLSDGTFRPSAFVTPVHFASTKAYDVDIGFAMVRDNFLFPERVALKELMQNSTPGGTGQSVGSVSTWHDAGTTSGQANDTETQLMAEMQALVATSIPHEPLPDEFLITYLRLHSAWASHGGRWTSQATLRCASQLLPFYMEWFLAVGATHSATASELRRLGKSDLFPRLAASLQRDIMTLARRGDDATVSRLVHHVLLALSLRADIPAPLITLISDLYVELHHFRVLFMRNQGASLLWKSIHTMASASLLATVAPGLLAQTQDKLRTGPPGADLAKRRSSLFGMGGRKHNGSSRKSLLFNAALVLPVATVASVQVFFHVNPVQLQLQLLPQLHELLFSSTKATTPASPLHEMIQFIERIAFFLMTDPMSPTWDKDIAQVLRMEDLFVHLHRRLIASVEAADHDGEETAMECIAALYRLELKCRRHASDVGEKKYWYLFHLLRQPIRSFHERLRDQLHELDSSSEPSSQAEGGGGSGETSDSVVAMNTAISTTPEAQSATKTGFDLLVHVLPKLPLHFVNEFVLVSLNDLLQLTRTLYALIDRFPSPSAVPSLVNYARQLLSILTLILRRTCDVDLQLLITRVVACSGSAVPSLVQLLLSESLRISSGAHAIELEIIAFADAFVTLTTTLPQAERWHTMHEPLYAVLENKEDVETNEQRKTMLMATVLSPENGVADSDDALWDTLQDVFLPAHFKPSDRATPSNMLRVVQRYHSQAFGIEKDKPLTYSPAVKDERRRNRAAYLDLRAKLFLSPIMDTVRVTTAQLRALVETHWDYIYQLRAKFSSSQMDPSECQSRVLLHLQCLLTLASQRSQFPVLDDAFLDFHIARELFKAVRGASRGAEKADECRASATALSLNLSQLQGGGMEGAPSSELLASTTTLHATTLLVVLACIVRDPHSLNDKLVPRYFIPSATEEPGERVEDEDFLLSLQHHLRVHGTCQLLASLHARLQHWEMASALGTAARAHALRRLVRILVADSYDSTVYESPIDSELSGACIPQDSGDAGECQQLVMRREYLAKGAFASVYRLIPGVPGSSPLAVKVCSHQKSSGERCVAAEVFHEVGVLERLRGTGAATQLVDYGNNTRETQGFEVVMEHCPATLAQWRHSLNSEGGSRPPPFRSLLILTLSVFIETAKAVAKIHESGVCHFDIKADNVLVREEAEVFTADLLKRLRSHESCRPTEDPQSWPICLGDFGEAVVLPPLPCEGVELTRTRGTEAIKSPEMLNVKGSATGSGMSDSPVLVGPASDVWSLGCLLYELLTEELLFGQDDWAQLYAHLVPESMADTPALRDCHRDKLHTVLKPRTDAERALATLFLQFIESIMKRTPANRPSLSKLIDEAESQLRSIQALPQQPADEEFELIAAARQPSDSVSSSAKAPVFIPPPPHVFTQLDIAQDKPRIGRLFWNLYLTSTVVPSSRRPLPQEDGHPLAGIRLLRELSAVQLQHEAAFSHYIYFTFDDVKHSVFSGGDVAPVSPVPSPPDDAIPTPVIEIVEGVGRTTFYFNRARTIALLHGGDSPSDSLVRLLLQHSRGILPVLQRHLCHQSKRVLVVPADYRAMRSTQGSTSSEIVDVTAMTLLFFLVTSCRVSPLEAIAAFSRECCFILDLPKPTLLHQIFTLHKQLTTARHSVATTERTVNARATVQCRCGDKVLAVASASLSSKTDTLMPRVPPPQDSEGDAEIVWDSGQAATVYGHHAGHTWRVVDTLDVDRLDSQLRTVLLQQLGSTASSAAVAASNSGPHPERVRRRSQNLLAIRPSHNQHGTPAQPSHRASDPHALLRDHVPFLLHGLHESATALKGGGPRRTQSSEALNTPTETWAVYECRLCSAPVCALSSSTTKVALPVNS